MARARESTGPAVVVGDTSRGSSPSSSHLYSEYQNRILRLLCVSLYSVNQPEPSSSCILFVPEYHAVDEHDMVLVCSIRG